MTEFALTVAALVLACVLGLIGIGVAALAVPDHPDRVKAAKVCFSIAGLVSMVAAYWGTSSIASIPLRLIGGLVWLAITVIALVFVFRFADNSLIKSSSSRTNKDKDLLRDKVDAWRHLILYVERKFKSGKEPGVSFTEILQRQQAYYELEQYLSQDAVEELQRDRQGLNPTVMGKVDGKDFANPPDRLRTLLLSDLARIEQSPDLQSALRPNPAINLLDQPKIAITFDEGKPEFIDPTTVKDHGEIYPCKLYRITVTTYSSSPVTRLLAKGVKNLTEGRTYPPLHLRITGKPPTEKEIRVHKGEPQFWDIVEKRDSDRNWTRLLETDIPNGHLIPIPSEFTVTASCDDGLSMTKRVVLRSRDNGDLDFQLLDV